MSKFVVCILDKAVWMLLATIITAQALQIAGIMETPKSAGAIEYQNSIRSLHQLPEDALRWKRDTSDTTERSQFIDTLFNRKKQKQPGWIKKIQNAINFYHLMSKIPIKTLTAVNNLIQNSRPMIRKFRDFVGKRFERTTKAPETDVDNNTVQKRSYPVFIRATAEKN